MELKITDGRGITNFCRIICERVERDNVEKVIIVSPWITPRAHSDYNLKKLLRTLSLSKRKGDRVQLTVVTRPPVMEDWGGAGKSHASALLQLLQHPLCRVDFVPGLHTKLYHVEFRDGFMGGRFTVFGSANWTWQAESNKNHETLLEIHGQQERLTELFLGTLNSIAELTTQSIIHADLARHNISTADELCKYLEM